MNEITCGVCMDLIPLVKDGIAGEESRQAVEQHVKTCGACRALYGGEAPSAPDAEKAFQKLRRQIRAFLAAVMMFGIFFGLGLTAENGMFYNSLIMPVIGALGYFIFRWRALYAVPALLLASHGLMNFLGMVRGLEHLDGYSLVMWTALYSIFAALGVLIAGLLCYAFRREK